MGGVFGILLIGGEGLALFDGDVRGFLGDGLINREGVAGGGGHGKEKKLYIRMSSN